MPMEHKKTLLETTDDCNEDNKQPQIYAKNSMDRFGDDLCQLLLSYLSLEDRFRMECLSKQFRRTVFGSVVDITLYNRFIQRLLIEKTIDTQLLATIAIKCPNIETIDFRGMINECKEQIPEVLRLLRDNCLNLREVYCRFNETTAQLSQQFGPLVTRINCNELSYDIVDTTSGQLLANNLKTFELNYYYAEDRQLFTAFVAHNQCLKSLNILDIYDLNDTLPELAVQLSRLTQLRELTLGLVFDVLDDQMSAAVTQCLRTIGVNCKGLKRLTLALTFVGLSETTFQISLDSLGVYRQLKRLHIRADEIIADLLLDPLRHCQRLTHLELCLQKMTANVLKDMHIKCPRLQYLFIGYFHNIDTESLSHVSRLPALQMLVIANDCEAESADLSDNDFWDLLSRNMAQQMEHKKTSLEITDDGNEDNKQPQIYAKNSMDRFGDDLCELLLSYLSFEDRFRLECVSKQFRRTVFVSVVDITLSDRFIQRLLIEKTIDTQLLATIAIKCPKIQIIDCRGIDREYKEHIPEVLSIFRDNCRHLREIYCNIWPISGQTTGSLEALITRIVGFWPIQGRPLSLYHRLSHLGIINIRFAFDCKSDQLLAKNLHKFELKFYADSDIDRWSAFVAQNQCLQSLAVKEFVFLTQEAVAELCGQVLRLPHLRELTLRLLTYSHIPINHSLLTIGVNCKQLQRLSLDVTQRAFSITAIPDKPVLQIALDSLGYYRRLKWLRLEVDAVIIDQLLDPLRHCKRLTHLELYIKEMTANVLKNLHQYCPRLQYLFIRDMNNTIDGECLSHISRLPALQTLVIDCHKDIDLLDIDLNAVLSSSPKLKTIEIRVNNEKKFYSK
ncbi:unnamed protein product [Medioppia subpectinata]|uniref:F-box domain-containing protein n=1 Tax=Medioppia subpectinata TaxID=1979941 RepID=A0A7R9KI47_9ACAR|nr:unnamed protein product [Medioppia subpectinata]CAG2103935.1 unnamed protein product [Medioppia subpectinata]